MHRLLKSIVGLVVGALSGGLIGATMLAVTTYFEYSAPPFGGPGWVIVGVYMGLILGGISGAIIGLGIGIASLNKAKGAIVGGVVGSIMLVILLFMGAAEEPLISALGVLSIAAGALVGLITSTLIRLLWNRKEPKPMPPAQTFRIFDANR
jgi:hypothetical protein